MDFVICEPEVSEVLIKCDVGLKALGAVLSYHHWHATCTDISGYYTVFNVVLQFYSEINFGIARNVIMEFGVHVCNKNFICNGLKSPKNIQEFISVRNRLSHYLSQRHADIRNVWT